MSSVPTTSAATPPVLSPPADATRRASRETPATSTKAEGAPGGSRALFKDSAPQGLRGGGPKRESPPPTVEVIELDLDGTDDDVIDLTRDGADASAASVSSKVKGEAAAPPHAPQKRAAADADVIVLSDGEEDTVPLALPPPKKEARLAAAAASAGPSAPGLPPPPPPAQSRRARRTAFLNAGPNGPRPVVRLGVRVDGGGGALYDIGSGLSTRMPFVPVQAQMDVMRGVAQALMQGRHALLQSPTGTGKTQALLCATLAFQAFVAAGGAPEDVPVIFLVVRTHAQMVQVMHELRRTAYRPLATLLAGRERLCVHPPALAPGANRARECEKATYRKEMTCQHLANQEGMAWPHAPQHLAHFLPGGQLEVADIEDLLALGTAAPHVCPYHTSRDLLPEGAGFVVATYGQLLDASIRKANGLEALLQRSVVVWDEAHNVPGVAREAASLLLDAPALAVLARELDGMRAALAAASPLDVPEKGKHNATVHALRQLVSRLQDWLRQQTAPGAPGDWRTDSAEGSAAQVAVQSWTRDGVQAQAVVSNALLHSASSLGGLRTAVRLMRVALIEANYESSAVKSSAINTVEEILNKLHMLMDNDPADFNLVVRRETQHSAARRAAAGGRPAPPPLPSVLFACLLGAVALKPVREAARCMLFASGTLGPPALLSSELELGNNCVAVSADHHTNIAQQLKLLVINQGQDVRGNTQDIVATFKNREPPLYQSIGMTLLQLLPHIPNGTLVFWPSSGMMSQAIDCWNACGIWDKLRQLFPSHIEIVGPAMTAEQANAAIARYRAVAAVGAAMLMAVLRGVASEGADFKDAACRGVIVVGLPFPPVFDAAVVMKKDFNDRRWGAGGELGGNAWYMAEGVRCAAQAIGRVIRHKDDFGAAILLDARYATTTGGHARAKGVRAMLPRYAQQLITVASAARGVRREESPAHLLREFFAGHAAAAAGGAGAAGPAAVKAE